MNQQAQEMCIECSKPYRDRGGPTTFVASFDVGDETCGGGHDARVTICGVCAKARVDSVLALTHKQMQQLARAR